MNKTADKVEGQPEPAQQQPDPQSPPAAPPVEYSTNEQILEDIQSGKLSPEQVLSDLDALEQSPADPVRLPTDPAAPPSGTAPASPADPNAPPAAPAAAGTGEQEVQVTIRPSWLKRAKSQYADVESMAKGVDAKDEMIDVQKTRISDLERHAQELTQKLQEAATAPPPAPAAPASPAQQQPDSPPEVVEMPSYDDVPARPQPLSGDDRFDDEKVAKYNEDLLAYETKKDEVQRKREQYLLNLATKPREPQAPPAPPSQQPAASAAADPTASAAPQPPQSDSAATEFAEISAFQAQNNAIFGTNRHLRDVENDYVKFVQDLAQVAGVTGGIYDASGQAFRPEVRSALQLYGNPATAEGKTLRDRCEATNVRPPEELPVLQKVYTVRKYRYRDASGNLIPYQDAYAVARAREPNRFVDPRAEHVADAEAENRVVTSRQSRTPESPAAGASSMVNINEIPQQEIDRIMQKRYEDFTPREQQVMRAYFKNAGMSDLEITNLIGEQKEFSQE